MERCQRCILRLNTVAHNQEGVCVHCQKYPAEKKEWDAGKAEFISTVESFRGKGKKYDVMVPITGGKDSVFALYCLTKFVPKLRILAVTWDHGFNREQAWQNIHNAIKATGVDHVIYRVGGSEEVARKLILGFHKTFGSPCEVCMLQHIIMPMLALEYEIPLVGWGFIKGQSGIVYQKGLYPYPLKEISDSFFLSSRVFKTVLRYNLADRMDQIIAEIAAPFNKAIQAGNEVLFHSLILGYFFDWNLRDQEVVKLLHDEFGFVKPMEEMTHTSCMLVKIRGYREYLYPPKKGLPFLKKAVPGPMEFETSTLVRSGAVSREYGLEEIVTHGLCAAKPLDTIEEYNRIVGIDMDTFDKLSARKKPPFKFVLFGLWQMGLNVLGRVGFRHA
jgi:hypothetical protein